MHGLFPEHVPHVLSPTQGLLHRPYVLLTAGGLLFAWPPPSAREVVSIISVYASFFSFFIILLFVILLIC